MSRRILMLLALLAMPLLLIAGPMTQKAIAQGTSTATVAPASGPPGASVIGSGANWTPEDQIQAQWADDNSNLGSPAVVASDGTFKVSFKVPASAVAGSHQILFWDIQSRYFVYASFTVAQATVGQAVTVTPPGNYTTSFMPGQGIWYGIITTNPGSVSVPATIAVKASGPQGAVIFNQAGPASLPPGTGTGIFASSVPNLAALGTYTNTVTVTVGGQSYVRQSSFTVGDHRLAGATKWMARASNRGLNYNELCETAVENAYGTSGKYLTALADYQAQLAAGRLHSETNTSKSTAPAGALVFFTGSDPTTGHVGIAVGDGKSYWTTDGTIHVAPLTQGIGYKGWSLAPLSWPGER
jgi:cell wall-associated NlpC family hydrolase